MGRYVIQCTESGEYLGPRIQAGREYPKRYQRVSSWTKDLQEARVFGGKGPAINAFRFVKEHGPYLLHTVQLSVLEST